MVLQSVLAAAECSEQRGMYSTESSLRPTFLAWIISRALAPARCRNYARQADRQDVKVGA
jgi:hypothetical protein